MQDLWPANIANTTVNDSPLSILRAQARLLGEKTKNLVTAEVGQGTTDNHKFVHHFYIVAPTLNNYHYRLFTIEYGIDLYPLTIHLDEVLGTELEAAKLTKGAVAAFAEALDEVSLGTKYTRSTKHYTITVSSQDTFTKALREILSSNRTRQVIGSILSQVVPDQLQPQLAT